MKDDRHYAGLRYAKKVLLMDANKRKVIDSETKKKLFRLAIVINLFGVAALILPQLYYEFYTYLWPLPNVLNGLFSEMLPVFEVIAKTFESVEVEKRYAGYITAILIPILVWPFLALLYLTRYRLEYKEFDPTDTAKQSQSIKSFQAKYKLGKVIIALLALFFMPITFLATGLTNTVMPPLIISVFVFLPTSQFTSFLLEAYVKWPWRKLNS